MQSTRRSPVAGFTLVELVLVLILVGIMAFVALPRFADVGAFNQRGAFDEVRSAVRYAQKLAVASGCPVTVTINLPRFFLQQPGNPDCSGALITARHPSQCNIIDPAAATPDDYDCDTPPGMGTSAATFTFDALGSTPADITVTVGGQNFQVENTTGYVR